MREVAESTTSGTGGGSRATRRGSARPPRRQRVLLATALASVAIPCAGARAQPRPVWIGSVAEERARDLTLLGLDAVDGLLLRSPSASREPAVGARGDSTEPGAGRAAPTGAASQTRGALRVRWLPPSLRLTSNSAIPFSLNDGAQWAGRGASGLARAGVALRRGALHAVLAPEITWAANGAFDLRAAEAPGRSPFASPWHGGRASIDLPSRFGDRALARVTLGQSAAWATAGAVAVGASTENAWWGPGRWSALVLGDNAEGFPHLFVRTERPLRTRLGVVEARYLLGTLVPSLYLDTSVTASWRAFNGVAATLRPSRAPDLTLGVSRTTVAPLARPGALGAHAVDALVRWQGAPGDSATRPRADQLTSAFARWVFPADGAEVYGEWARQTTPRSLRELLVAPQDGRALTLGARALRPIGARRAGAVPRYLRAELELTTTEQSITFRDRPVPQPFYTGLATREGYTHRGQLLGAAVGPGASAQWFATDLIAPRGSVGVVLGRVRWENDALYAQRDPNFFRHDVTTLLGVRAQGRLPLADLRADASWARRYNYLFQNGIANPGGRRTVDVTNVTLGLSVTPR